MPKTHTVLINRCRKGDEKAMMKVYDLYCDAMYQIACRYVNEEDAKDAMQESFIKAFTKLNSFTDDFTFGSWIKRIVINHCIDELKKRQLVFSDTEVTNLSVDDNLNWDFDTRVTKKYILEAIGKLPDKHQVVVKLYLIEGYDHAEISSIIGIPIKTSRTHLRRGRLQLQELLKNRYDEARY